MATTVECRLILEAADSDLPADESPNPERYPNRLITSVPGELAPLVRLTSIPYTITSNEFSHYQKLASGIIASGLGDAWRVDTSYYVSGSQEVVSGEWQPASGYAFRFLKGGRYYENSLAGIGEKCVCRYLLSVRFLADEV